ncbi:multidrug and toxin extrusion protein 1-like [Haliotis rufescens]|uniref:multidrug and toxin extrusion protein 1-like n=1 Tax=Haliotis rufescens TaxID=6454 RepID=UPI00201E7524|nr:multidrug and toxin extrusion protein 1-like [Haliotis rufescens]
MGLAGVMDSSNSDEEQKAEETAPKTYHRCLRLNKWKFSKAYKDELRAMLTLAWPVTVSSTLEQLILVTNAMFTGHLGTLQLDATALGQAVIDVMLHVRFQTYGSTNKKNLGILLQRALLINILACFPCVALFMNVERILLAFGQDPTLSRLTGNYVTTCIPGLPALAAMMVMCKYLCAQGIVLPTLLILTLSNLFNLFCLYVFLPWAGLDMVGAALAICLAYGSGLIMHALYIHGLNTHNSTWAGINLSMRSTIY